ncbi:Fic family protein [Halomonas sp. MCCC 1A11036]|uniref:Fic family protein n=1 Tax=Billgrantia zhangzhouensis TaxID=2733481 RepID=A0ABS9ADT6_9GAMM|nr:Fic family protein [Halomonas zhangzhouensis]MCE8019886.1 Fic family protein [Halomonas zhangzhouensis]
MPERTSYRPPFTLTPFALRLVAEISEAVGRYTVLAERGLTPQLRRENRLRTIHASLAIENNTLSLEQVSAVIEGKRVLGHPREIQEVRNAFSAYEAMPGWAPESEAALLEAHSLLMQGLVDEAGSFRSRGVGIYKGTELVHMAPPAHRVPLLVGDLLEWLSHTDEHPLIASAVVHYELEFIHPFADGNGRMGRLWQTLILRRWRPLLAYLPVETVIRDRQQEYYDTLAEADRAGEATPFIEFMLTALRDALAEAVASEPDAFVSTTQLDEPENDPASDPASDPVARLITVLATGEAGTAALMTALGLSHRPTFRKNYLAPALDGAWIEPTHPEKPNSPKQRYRLTPKAKRWLKQHPTP